jgi:hypothetical protein
MTQLTSPRLNNSLDRTRTPSSISWLIRIPLLNPGYRYFGP